MRASGLALCLSGASLDTGNCGVEALGRSVLAEVGRVAPGSRVMVFDNGWGVRDGPRVPGVEVTCCGARRSRRLHRRESWVNIRVSQRLGGGGNAAARGLRDCDAVMDISGGDSFTDIYGPGRLRTVLEPKRAALRARRPLILLPQTYGPFTAAESRALAAGVVQRAEMAIARDEQSYGVLLDLLGPHADAHRHVRGVDVAFALAARRPTGPAGQHLVDVLESARQRPIAGVNVSGLLWHGNTPGPSFALTADYELLCRQLVAGLVADGADVLLVPHVRDVAHGAEDDRTAAEALVGSLPPPVARHVRMAPDDLDADEMKWVISRLDWFCGARMHATIAGLSSGVPTAAVAYSVKTSGVFETCGLGGEVVEARTTTTDEAVARLLDAFARREVVRRRIEANVPAVVDTARQQLGGVLQHVESLRSHHVGEAS